MFLDRQETAGRVKTEWHRCPVCHKVHMRSQLDQSTQAEADWGELQDSHTEKSTVAYSRRQGIAYA